MILPIAFDHAPYAVGMFITRKRGWSPLGKAVSILIEDCCDGRWVNQRVHGVVRAFDPDATGEPLLIQLQVTLGYEASRSCRSMDFLVATSAMRWHGPSRLLLTWAAVRLVDAPSFVDQSFLRTIGFGRLTLL